MSREIKFRAWDKDSKRYGEVVEIEYNESREIDGIWVWYNIHERYEPIPGANVTVEQYTGLKDKNGKEIYEGDIVEWVNGLGEKHIFEIMWNECRASFQMVEIGQEYPYILQGLSDKMKPYCEVIGNIHENPELLGDGE